MHSPATSVFTHKKKIDSQQLTPASCWSRCLALLFSYFGLAAGLCVPSNGKVLELDECRTSIGVCVGAVCMQTCAQANRFAECLCHLKIHSNMFLTCCTRSTPFPASLPQEVRLAVRVGVAAVLHWVDES